MLNIYDLTALGTGSTLGCGVYVLAGTVAREFAGPGVVLSFILAAIVSSFSGASNLIINKIQLSYYLKYYEFGISVNYCF